MQTVYLFSHSSEHTTARYFESAINKLDGWKCVYLDRPFDTSILVAEDILFYVDPTQNWPLGLERVPCLCIAYFIDVHLDISSRMEMGIFFDVIFIAQCDYLPEFQKFGHRNVHWLPLACDPLVHKVGDNSRTYDVGFVGNIGYPGMNRYKVLSSVLTKYKTNNYFKYHSPKEMGEIYGQSKIVFNASIRNDLNMRVFEAMASGGLLVTDRIGNGLATLFVEGTHYVGYSGILEAVDKISFYLSNHEERIRIATSGQDLVIAQHNYSNRWETIKKLSHGMRGLSMSRRLTKKELGGTYAYIYGVINQPWRIWGVISEYGLNTTILVNMGWAWGRWLNSVIPFTPNALQVSLRRFFKKRWWK